MWADSFMVGMRRASLATPFYKNLGNGKFEEVSDKKSGRKPIGPWGVSVDDLKRRMATRIMFITAGMSYHFPLRHRLPLIK